MFVPSLLGYVSSVLSVRTMEECGEDIEIEFEEDADALASILNNRGVTHTMGYRQTIATNSMKHMPNISKPKKTSIYYQGPIGREYKNMMLRRLTYGESASFQKNAKYVNSPGRPPVRQKENKPISSCINTPQRVLNSKASTGKGIAKSGGRNYNAHRVREEDDISVLNLVHHPTDVTQVGGYQPAVASVRNPSIKSSHQDPNRSNFETVFKSQEITSSPFLNSATPASARKKRVQWAKSERDGNIEETCHIPSALELAKHLFTDETQAEVPGPALTKAREVELIQAEVTSLTQNYEEISEIDKQLELEIQKLCEEGFLQDADPSAPSVGNKPSDYHQAPLVYPYQQLYSQPSGLLSRDPLGEGTTPMNHVPRVDYSQPNAALSSNMTGTNLMRPPSLSSSINTSINLMRPSASIPDMTITNSLSSVTFSSSLAGPNCLRSQALSSNMSDLNFVRPVAPLSSMGGTNFVKPLGSSPSISGANFVKPLGPSPSISGTNFVKPAASLVNVTQTPVMAARSATEVPQTSTNALVKQLNELDVREVALSATVDHLRQLHSSAELDIFSASSRHNPALNTPYKESDQVGMHYQSSTSIIPTNNSYRSLNSLDTHLNLEGTSASEPNAHEYHILPMTPSCRRLHSVIPQHHAQPLSSVHVPRNSVQGQPQAEIGKPRSVTFLLPETAEMTHNPSIYRKTPRQPFKTSSRLLSGFQELHPSDIGKSHFVAKHAEGVGFNHEQETERVCELTQKTSVQLDHETSDMFLDLKKESSDPSCLKKRDGLQTRISHSSPTRGGMPFKDKALTLFNDALVDQECALYTCLQGKFSPKSPVKRDFSNPVAKILTHGDDLHFVPVGNFDGPILSTLPGSAFSGVVKS